MVSLIIQTLNSGANQPLYTSFIKFDVKDFISLIKKTYNTFMQTKKLGKSLHLTICFFPECQKFKKRLGKVKRLPFE